MGTQDGTQPKYHGLLADELCRAARRQALAERHHAGLFHGGRMDEHILTAAIRRNESIALARIIKLHCTDSHREISLGRQFPPRKTHGWRGTLNIKVGKVFGSSGARGGSD